MCRNFDQELEFVKTNQKYVRQFFQQDECSYHIGVQYLNIFSMLLIRYHAIGHNLQPIFHIKCTGLIENMNS